MTIQDFFKENPKVAIACSGGVDSVFLVYLAHKYAKEVRAYFVKSAFQPRFELEDAAKLCAQIKVELTVLEVDVLGEERVAANPADRCYHCKKMVFYAIADAAAADGIQMLLDGTNASDDVSERPGMKALQELHVCSPLRMCGCTKEEIRRGAKEAGLPVHDKPAYACLATRIPVDHRISEELLGKIEQAEGVLFAMGFTDFRVRIYYEMAKIQIPEAQFPALVEKREEIQKRLSRWFDIVTLDLQTR